MEVNCLINKNMEENKKVEEKTVTISFSEYEKLQAENVKMRQQCSEMYKAITEMRAVIAEKRLGYLFKVIENKLAFDDEFVQKCTSEIMEALVAPEETEEGDK